MKKSRYPLGAYILAVAVIMFFAACFRTAALVADFDPASGYFKGKTFITIADWSAALAILTSLSYFFTKASKKKLVATYTDATTYIPSALVAVATGCLTVKLFFRLLGAPESELITVSLTNLLSVGLGAITVIAFFISCLHTSRRDLTRAGYQLVAVLFFVVYSAFIYFANPLPINVPVVITDVMAYLSVAVFFVYETRISLGRDIWGAYCAFGLVAVALLSYSSVPSIIAYFVRGEAFSHSIEENVLTFALLLFVLLRLIRATMLFEDGEAQTVRAIKELEKKAALEKAEADTEAEEGASEDEDAEDDASEENDNYTFELEGEDASAQDGEEEE